MLINVNENELWIWQLCNKNKLLPSRSNSGTTVFDHGINCMSQTLLGSDSLCYTLVDSLMTLPWIMQARVMISIYNGITKSYYYQISVTKTRAPNSCDWKSFLTCRPERKTIYTFEACLFWHVKKFKGFKSITPVLPLAHKSRLQTS